VGLRALAVVRLVGALGHCGCLRAVAFTHLATSNPLRVAGRAWSSPDGPSLVPAVACLTRREPLTATLSSRRRLSRCG
jgi:hypothetical protein